MKNKQRYVIGVDGGGTKSAAVLADLEGRILRRAEAGSTNPHKVGMEKALSNLEELLSNVAKNYSKEKIDLAYLGLAGGLERDREKRGKRGEIQKTLEKKFPFSVKVEGDQKAAFRSGSNKKDGIVIIAGTGSISMGWRGKNETISGGGDWLLGDQGSAFWVGKKALEELMKSIDGRKKPLPKLHRLIVKEYRIKKQKDFYKNFYGEDFVTKVASVSKVVEAAAKEKDKMAQEILKEAGEELAQMARAVIKKLKFKEKFPCVLVGGMFKSIVVLDTVKKEIKKFVPKVEFIRSEAEPVIGAVKLALAEVSPHLAPRPGSQDSAIEQLNK